MFRRILCNRTQISSLANGFLRTRQNINGIQIGVAKINTSFSTPLSSSSSVRPMFPSSTRRPLTDDEKSELKLEESLKKWWRSVANYIPFLPYERIPASEHLTRTQLSCMEKIPEIQTTYPDVIERYESALVLAGRHPVRVSNHFLLCRAISFFMIGLTTNVNDSIFLWAMIYYFVSSHYYNDQISYNEVLSEIEAIRAFYVDQLMSVAVDCAPATHDNETVKRTESKEIPVENK